MGTGVEFVLFNYFEEALRRLTYLLVTYVRRVVTGEVSNTQGERQRGTKMIHRK